ncbi:MAG TPA: hypothetical protein VMU19_00695 [Bryobacteraceae bacterium]|nr:hypothetical protein [Bryobacteraceae bacterium]
MSIAAAFAADKETPFTAPAATAMAHKQTSEQVTIGADPFDTAAKTKTAFAKLDPNEYGVLPVLVVIQNDSSATIDLSHLQAQYKEPGARAVDFTPASEVKYVRGARPPGVIGTPTGGVAAAPRLKKNPLEAWEIEGRAFAAKMIPPGKSASGFFYFQGSLKPGATISLDGLTQAPSGKALFYFEVPLE